MTMASVGSQWLKKTILQRNLPNKQKEDVKSLLILDKTEAGDDIYKKVKTELLRIYAPKPTDSYCKALSRTMTGLPSQLGLQIVNDICKKPVKLQGCCCPAGVQAIWQLQLPVNIRAHISNMVFTHDNYKQVFEAADQVYLSSKQISVAAMSMTPEGNPALDETVAAFKPHNQPQVAAVARGRGNRGGRGGRGNRGGRGQGGQSGQSRPARGPRHSSNPPDSCCDRHYSHGAGAWFCLKPLTCPWVSKITPRP